MTRWGRATALGALAAVLVGACTGLEPAAPGQPADEVLARWSLDGSPTSGDVFAINRGAEHCDWESATFLHMGWPPGEEIRGGNGRQFVRDPEQVLPGDHADLLGLGTELPVEATPTGFANEAGTELWSDTDGSTAYLVADDGSVEAWPRAEPLIGCD